MHPGWYFLFKFFNVNLFHWISNIFTYFNVLHIIRCILRSLTSNPISILLTPASYMLSPLLESCALLQLFFVQRQANRNTCSRPLSYTWDSILGTLFCIFHLTIYPGDTFTLVHWELPHAFSELHSIPLQGFAIVYLSSNP